MVMPGEDPKAIAREDKVWELLAPWMKRGDGTLVRSASYRFRSLLAQGWRRGRLIIAGDAAHLMPPFMGQGMCSGLRDAWTLAWKLHRVLSGTSPDTLLDLYEPARAPHVDAVIRISMEMGRIVCVPDGQAARARDEAFFAGKVPPPPPFPGLTGGLIDRDDQGRPRGLAGRLTPHDVVEKDGIRSRLDELAGRRFVLVTRDIDPDAATAAAVEGADIAWVRLGAGGARDVDGRLAAFLQSAGADAYLARPDFYAYGSATGARDIARLVASLGNTLTVAGAAP
jgi:hypothetical protein